MGQLGSDPDTGAALEWWIVAEREHDDGSHTIRFAYMDGTTANMHLPPGKRNLTPDSLLAGWARKSPPPPQRPSA